MLYCERRRSYARIHARAATSWPTRYLGRPRTCSPARVRRTRPRPGCFHYHGRLPGGRHRHHRSPRPGIGHIPFSGKLVRTGAKRSDRAEPAHCAQRCNNPDGMNPSFFIQKTGLRAGNKTNYIMNILTMRWLHAVRGKTLCHPATKCFIELTIFSP